MNRVGSARRPCFVSLGALDVMGGRKGSGIEGGKNRRGRKEMMPVMELEGNGPVERACEPMIIDVEINVISF